MGFIMAKNRNKKGNMIKTIRVSNLIAPISQRNYANIPKWILEKAAAAGTEVHKSVEDFITSKSKNKLTSDSQNEKVINCIKAFNKFLEACPISGEGAKVEQTLFKEYDNFILQGTPDLVYKNVIYDWKTRSSFASKDNFLSEKLQMLFYMDLSGAKSFKIVILNKKSADYKIIDLSHISDKEYKILIQIKEALIEGV